MRFRVRKIMIQATLALGLVASLQGCALLLLGAAGGGALVAVDRRTLGAQTEDREIQVKAAARLADQLPDQAHVNTSVFNRRVLLTGEVPNEAAKQRAEAIVREMNNVNSIVNELAIQGASSLSSRANDTYLDGRVKAALIQEKNLSAYYFKVVTERNVVYLMGLVTVDEGNRGADAASRVSGVAQVVKVFQYIEPDEAQRLAATPAQPAPNSAAGSNADSQGATVGAVPDTSVTSQPLEYQAPAPIGDSTAIHPGSPRKTP